MSEHDDLKARWKGLWENKKGSHMRITQVKTITEGEDRTHYRIRGTYQTAVGRPGSETRFPLTGFVTGDQIVFTVSFRVADDQRDDEDEPNDSMTAWAGQLLPDPDNDDTQLLQTLWHLTRNAIEDTEEDAGWATVLGGADNFRKLDNDPDAEPTVTGD